MYIFIFDLPVLGISQNLIIQLSESSRRFRKKIREERFSICCDAVERNLHTASDFLCYLRDTTQLYGQDAYAW